MMLQEQQSLRKTLVPKSAPVSVRSRSERAPQLPSTLCRATSNTDDDEGDVLWPLPAHNNNHSPSPPSMLSHSPNSRSFMTSPRPHRHRAHTTDNVTFSRPVPAVLALRQVPKDPIQPKQGSIQDIHSSVAEADEGGEDGDVFSEMPAMRPRSSTCPASMNRARRVKLRSMRRPPTPPPMDLVDPVIDTSRMRSAMDASIQEETELTSKLTGKSSS